MGMGCPNCGFDNGGRKTGKPGTILIMVKVVFTGLLFLLASCWVSSAHGQAVYGSIGGTVVDSSGGGVVAAKVTITDLDRNIVRSTETTGNGN
jgi:hypothetical protein